MNKGPPDRPNGPTRRADANVRIEAVTGQHNLLAACAGDSLTDPFDGERGLYIMQQIGGSRDGTSHVQNLHPS
jgi:hypothetical protein